MYDYSHTYTPCDLSPIQGELFQDLFFEFYFLIKIFPTMSATSRYKDLHDSLFYISNYNQYIGRYTRITHFQQACLGQI